MNGIISETASRSSLHRPSLVSAMILGVCLFTGFASGINISPEAVSHLNPFRTETIRFDKISWISDAKESDLKIASINLQNEAPLAANDLTFVPFELKQDSVKHANFSRFSRGHKNFKKLQLAMNELLQATHYDAFEDYVDAITHLRREFSYVMNDSSEPANEKVLVADAPVTQTPAAMGGEKPFTAPTHSSVPTDTVAITSSSAEVPAQNGVSVPETKTWATKDVISKDAETANLPAKTLKTSIILPVPAAQASESTAQAKVYGNSPGSMISKNSAPSSTKTGILAMMRTNPITVNSAPIAIAVEQKPKTHDSQKNDTVLGGVIVPAKINSSSPLVATQSVSSQAKVSTGTPLAANKFASVTTMKTASLDRPLVTTSGLTEAEQKKLSDQLITLQATNRAQTLEGHNQILAQRDQIKSEADGKFLSEPINDDLDNKDFVSESKNVVNARANFEAAPNGTDCTALNNHQFVMPSGAAATDATTQTCPSQVSWISKPFYGPSWIKVTGNNFFQTMTLDPAPNGGATLLLDDNSLGMIAIKSGVHVTRGMGLVAGRVPDGYKVSFMGRAEETEYFDSTGKHYFVILNAEPGAGVVELESKTNPNLSSTLFTPVLEDTITYLDLVQPISKDLEIKVVKSGAKNDPEVSKLTVGLSTQSGIKGITRANGQATLKDVNLVPGFPVFVDVASRSEDSDGYTYRYELKRARKSGIYVVNEVSEKTIHHWLGQVNQGLSDQSAMVIGLYDRTKLDGFKTLHFSKVEPLTAKYGLEPINYTVLWNGKISTTDPLEGDVPRFMAVQIPEGLSEVNLLNESKQVVSSELIPVSPRVINVISE